MPFYDIAGLVVEIKHPTGRTEKQARPYQIGRAHV